MSKPSAMPSGEAIRFLVVPGSAGTAPRTTINDEPPLVTHRLLKTSHSKIITHKMILIFLSFTRLMSFKLYLVHSSSNADSY